MLPELNLSRTRRRADDAGADGQLFGGLLALLALAIFELAPLVWHWLA